MKKLGLGLVLVSLLFLAGCTHIENGKYKEGTYFGSNVGEKTVATAVVYVASDGKIKSVFLDTTYVKNNVSTTKKILGVAYGMKGASPIGKEWFEQVNTLEAKIVKEQGLEWFKYSNTEKTEIDSVSGVTITVDALYNAVKTALDQAK